MGLGIILCGIYLLFVFLCLAVGVLHIIQTKTSRYSYHVNEIPNLETMVCDKVERNGIHAPVNTIQNSMNSNVG
jgi:hypothetical protein